MSNSTLQVICRVFFIENTVNEFITFTFLSALRENRNVAPKLIVIFSKSFQHSNYAHLYFFAIIIETDY